MAVPKIRSFRRTKKSQVVPDAMLRRRSGYPFSAGSPVSPRAVQAYKDGKKSKTTLANVFDDVAIDYVFDAANGLGSLVFGKSIHSISAKLEPSLKMNRYALFSSTTKMAAPSFSIPAGPVNEGGSCVAASFRAASLQRPGTGHTPDGLRTDDEGNPFICDLCYATAGSFWYTSTSTAQVARLTWARRLLAKDPTGRLLGQAFVTAIRDMATRGHYKNTSKRRAHELGVWRNGALMAPGIIVGRKGLYDVSIPPTRLRIGPHATSTEFLAAGGVRDGEIAGFFRIHDSGDFNIRIPTKGGRTVDAWKGYLDAWRFVARALPHVYFWAPTRVWKMKGARAHLSADPLPNLIIRASAMFVNDEAPHIPQVSASSVHNKGRLGRGHHSCPVTPDLPAKTTNCATMNCRACWTAPSITTSYEEH